MKRGFARAFTLFEVLIALALMLALVGTMFGFLFDMLHSRGRAQEYGGQQRAASTLIDRLDADLTACIVGDSETGAGVQGDESHLRILTRAVFANAAETSVDEADVFGDLQLAEYRFVPQQQRLEARRMPAGSSSTSYAAYLPFHDPKAAIPHMRFRYFNGQQWSPTFDSLESNRLPVAVEVAIWFNAWPNDSLNQPANSNDESEASPAGTRPQSEPSAAFDDDAYAHRADRDGSDEPSPDRIRVILIPDAAGDDEGGGTS